jgi:NAD(P)-dependent dehydrogenase (short-subunit alcohol dehydrogenase family)
MEAPEKVAIVTGGGRGIGLGIAHCLAAAGYRVALWDRDGGNAVDGAAALRAAGAMAFGIACDVSDYAAVEAAALASERGLGRATLLVNNAGTRHRARLEDLSRADWDNEVGVNLSGAFYCTQVVGRRMLEVEHGSIVNIASMSARSGLALRGAYTPTKAGVVGLTMLTAVEWGGRGIRCNAVSPGIVASPGNADVYGNEALFEGRRAAVPMGRLGTAQDIGDVVVFLGSDAARYINGVNLPVDGGATPAHISLYPTVGPDGRHLASALDALPRRKG